MRSGKKLSLRRSQRYEAMHGTNWHGWTMIRERGNIALNIAVSTLSGARAVAQMLNAADYKERCRKVTQP